MNFLPRSRITPNPRRRWRGAGDDQSSKSKVLPYGPQIDLNFATGTYYGVGAAPPSSFLTTTRASIGMAVDSRGSWTSFAANTPRITNLGLLVEESRTNSIRNNTMQGAAAGSPGTLPTNWSAYDGGGFATQAIVGTGTENGIAYIDIRLTGSTSNQYAVYFDTTTAIAAANAQAWAFSAFVKLVAGSLTDISSMFSAIDQYSSAPAFLATVNGGAFTPGSNSTPLGQCRITGPVTTNNASTASIQPYISFLTAAGPFDLTLRIGWPQLELGAFATSPIPTAAAAVTRAADVITLASPPAFGGAYSLLAQGTPQAPASFAANQVIFNTTLPTVTTDRSTLARVATTATAQVVMRIAGVNGYNQSSASAWAQNAPGKLAVAYAPNLQNAAFNGALMTGGSNAALPATPTEVDFGTVTGGTNAWDGLISRIALWPTTALSAAQLQQITT